MSVPQAQISISPPEGRTKMLYAILFFWGLAAVCIFLILLSAFGFDDPDSKFYLLPWCLATGVVICSPSALLIYRGRFHPFHPLVYPAWSYFFPGFFIGGLVLATGISQPYFLTFVQDERYNLPLTFVYIMLGYGGLVLGFSIPYAKWLGTWIGNKLPTWEISTDRVSMPAGVLLIVGIGNTIVAFADGLLGFQKADVINSYDGIIYLLSLLWLQGSFLLWLYIFRSPKLRISHLLIIGAVLITTLSKTAFQGNRGGLLGIVVEIAFAYMFSGRRTTGKHYAVGTILVVLALVGGMIYGSTFRSIKDTQEQIAFSEYASVVSATFDKIGDEDLGTVLEDGFSALANRIDSVSSLAVVVSNYEALAPYEEIWGINNNIYVDTVTFFVPRVIWPDKPISIEPQKYADLYFNYSENSFTMTPMGDLLRNFGPWSIPIGMMILGFLIRMMYASLVEGRSFSYWRSTVFFMLLVSISYEGTYGLIVPTLFKIGLTAFAGMGFVYLLSRWRSGAPANP